jgi:hypothetical protein
MLYKIYVKYFISLCPPSELRLQNCFIAFLFGRLWSDFRLLPRVFHFPQVPSVILYAFIFISYMHLQSSQCSNIYGDAKVKK